MDAILRSTIRVTKCLLSHGVVQENVEKIILEAFVDEVERYPVLYEDNVHTNNGWTVHKNCTVCKIVIPELDSKCFGCSKTVCRFVWGTSVVLPATNFSTRSAWFVKKFHQFRWFVIWNRANVRIFTV